MTVCDAVTHASTSLGSMIRIPASIPSCESHAKHFTNSLLGDGHMTFHMWQKDRDSKKISGFGRRLREERGLFSL